MAQGENPVRDLEHALVARARELVREHLAKAAAERERLLAECGQRLRLREEREMLAAKAEAERLYRQRVQAAEIRLQGELDRLRWTLMHEVLDRARGRLEALVADEDAYLPLLRGLIASGAALVGTDRVVAELSARDHARLAARWPAFARESTTAQTIELAPTAVEATGGAVLRDRDNTVRVDNTFEGRLDRMQEAVQRAILERMFAEVPEMGTLFHG